LDEFVRAPETTSDIDLLHEIGSRMAAADPLHEVLERVIEMVTAAVRCDSCFIYVLEKEKLVLRASKNPHEDVVDRLVVEMGQGVTGWVAEHRQTVALPSKAWADPRFAHFAHLPEDRFEAFLAVPILCRGKLVGAINMQHRVVHHHSKREIKLITMIGYLVGAEVELARMEYEKSQLAEQLETRKVMERAKGILQRELNIDEEAAYLMLQKQSRQKRRPLKEIAEAIILMEDLKRGKK
jgi:uroporphyrinogen-III synthase